VTVSFLWEPANTSYVPLAPARVLDTRNGTGAPAARLGGGATIDVPVTGVGGVPAGGVSAVVLNVTATDYSGPADYLTVFPTGSPRPLASNLNITPGKTVPNLVVARVGSGGKVSIYNNAGTVSVLADVQGYYATSATGGSRYQPLAPARVLDTRDGTGGNSSKVQGGTTIDLTVTGAGGVPASGVTAVALNVTATDVSGPDTFVTVFPWGAGQPLASNLNAVGGQSVPNLVIVRVGDGGRVSLYNNLGTVDLVADVQGWFGGSAGSTFVPVSPVRALDTRNGTGAPAGSVGPGGIQELTVTGVNGVPGSGVTAVVLNVTVNEPTGPDSFLTVYPNGAARPLASNLNYVAGQTVANLVVARVGSNGKILMYNNLGRVQLIADVEGWFSQS
jgi:hypothetical protein